VFIRGSQEAISDFPGPAGSRPAQRATDAGTKRPRQDACRQGNTCFCPVTISCDYSGPVNQSKFMHVHIRKSTGT